MTSLHTISAFGSHGPGNKISKPRAKAVVRPILKKWPHASPKTSLDLDRGWNDQEDQVSHFGWGDTTASSRPFYELPVNGARSAKDVSLSFDEAVAPASSRRFNHSRSMSGTSHVSVATSNSCGSGAPAPRQAGATFVHPFQQTPRTSTPPLSYANSLASFADNRDYSPTITEVDDIDYGETPSSHNNSLHNHRQIMNPYSHSQSSLNPRRPSLASQRTSSFTEINNPQPPPRINTSRTASSAPAQSSRLAHVSSRSDLHLDHTLDSPVSITSPQNSIAPMSPLRTSLDASGFPRLRAKSDLDTATRADHLKEARRKFEMKERAKEEKYAREEIKRRERADNKRAQEMERQAAAARKEQMAAQARREMAELEEALPSRGGAGGKHSRKVSIASSGRPSLSMSRPSLSLTTTRPSTSRKNTSTPMMDEPEKFASSSYDHMNPQSPPAFGHEAGGAQDVLFQSTKRRNTAKKKTQGTWTMFILWLRTKLLRVGKNR
ncbi:hypothetical protein F4778DRAFT_308158 [Xylariomycetidae sp. FL2044]|nr:hypothetical protein F4778DRAFT_308158 [Xylariomycetidae sp. FL2044]